MWVIAPSELTLSHDTIHVWRVDLEALSAGASCYRTYLSVDEAARADSYYFERDRDHFTVARGTLRLLLGRYLGHDPATLSFRYNQYGKPELDMAPEYSQVRFNISHSGGLALCAVARAREVGVDVERTRSDIAFVDMAANTFSETEAAAVRSAPVYRRQAAFYNCWTRKEAYIKARGMGLSLPLDGFDVSLLPGEPAALLHTAAEPAAVRNWSLRALQPGPGFVGAVAAEGHDWEIACWEYRP